MAGFSNSAKSDGLGAIDAAGTWVSLHTADPGTTGASEATGGSPAYARKQATWGSVSAGSVSMTGALTFDVPAGTYTHFSIWTASTAGTFKESGPLTPSSTTFGAQGQYVLDTLTLTATG